MVFYALAGSILLLIGDLMKDYQIMGMGAGMTLSMWAPLIIFAKEPSVHNERIRNKWLDRSSRLELLMFAVGLNALAGSILSLVGFLVNDLLIMDMGIGMASSTMTLLVIFVKEPSVHNERTRN